MRDNNISINGDNSKSKEKESSTESQGKRQQIDGHMTIYREK